MLNFKFWNFSFVSNKDFSKFKKECILNFHIMFQFNVIFQIFDFLILPTTLTNKF